MKITTTKLKQLIREAIEDEFMDDDFEPNPGDYMTDAEKDHEWAETAEVTASGFDLDPMVKDQLMQMAQQIRSGALAGEGDITAAFAKIVAAAKGGLREGHQGSKDDVKIVKDKKTGKYKIKDGGKFARGGKSYDTRKAAEDSDEYAELTTPGGDW